MEIYFIEYIDSVEFLRKGRRVRLSKGKVLNNFLRTVYHKYGSKIKFKSML